jgi:hypothetical protein
MAGVLRREFSGKEPVSGPGMAFLALEIYTFYSS